jgi:hypothetical protein
MIGSYEYFVPNYGYLVLIDSNYKDIDESITTMIPLKQTKYYKILSNIFEDKMYTDAQLHEQCFDAFVNTFNTNNFSKSFSNFGGSAIPEDVKELLNKITKEITISKNKDIKYYIQRFMGSLLNNRVGTLINEIEQKFINQTATTDFKEGQIIVHLIASNTYNFVIYSGKDTGPGIGMHKILTKNTNNEFDIISVQRGELFHYSKDERIVQTFKANEINFSEDNLLETYICQ